MFSLYPRLDLLRAHHLARDHASKSVIELATQISPSLEGVVFAPTGGNRIERAELEALRNTVLARASSAGYPGAPSETGAAGFDAECAALLHTTMRLHPSEASHIEVWAFLTCQLLPDVVRWRFPGTAEAPAALERYVGTSRRGLWRNAFGRLWWRAHRFHTPGRPDPYGLLALLTEDEIVQLTERPSLAADAGLLVQFSGTFLAAYERNTAAGGRVARRELIRESVKRLRRLLPMTAFDLLDQQVVGSISASLIDDTLRTATKTPVAV
ncbi:MAG: hypothetical protein IT318_14860 [Anaerolineales bacterium]|nr:hypothetical protein [Anaerolineales bacterium]